jgi:2-oxoglutarate dehydrogenase E2 component (dihydrolipoamide succinyltransferase)
MAVELKVPAVGESISEVEIGEWLKSEGDRAEKDDNLVVIETEKVTFELSAPVSGTLTKVLKQKGNAASVGEVIGYMEPAEAVKDSAPRPPEKKTEETKEEDINTRRGGDQGSAVRAAKAEAKPPRIMPAAQRALAESGLRPEEVKPSGPGGRVLKEDVVRRIERPAPSEKETVPTTPAPAPEAHPARQEEAVPMSPMRRQIAKRLVEAQQTAALLTTFNEIDMSAVGSLRQQHQAGFQDKYKIKLGFMSFFIKAAIEALKLITQVNAEIRGNDIVYRNYYDIGVAVGSGKGLVVPVLRNADRMSFAEIELAIADFVRRAQENKLQLDELQGGTFTISNGGIYGSLLSTPIINPPQSGILGMHAIQDRPVARDGAVVIRPMMYVALTYDHRIVDGREAVAFLRRIKETVEDPARILLEV